MSHIRVITKSTPKSANVLQDLICQLIIIASSLLSAKSGSIPGLTVLDDKCQPMPVA